MTATTQDPDALMEAIVARRLTCDDPSSDLIPDHPAGVVQYVLTHRRVPRGVLTADAQDALAMVPMLRKQTSEIAYNSIRMARDSGISWARIGQALGLRSPQAAHQYYRRLADARTGEQRSVAAARNLAVEQRGANAGEPRGGAREHRKVRIDAELWTTLGILTARDGTTRSALLRNLARDWARRRLRSLESETKGALAVNDVTAQRPELAWAEHNRAAGELIVAELAELRLPDYAALSVSAAADVLNDPTATPMDLPIWLQVLYTELDIADELSLIPASLRDRLSELVRGWKEVTTGTEHKTADGEAARCHPPPRRQLAVPLR